MTEKQIIEALLEFIDSDTNSDLDEQFNRLALALFAYQFEHNRPYRQFCTRKMRTPMTVRTWSEIPPVPLDAFKEFDLSCCDPSAAERVFMTSGTTQGVRGKSYHPSLKVYDASMRRNFAARFMRDKQTVSMGILFPPPDEMPNSSLAHYLDLALRDFGTPDSVNFFRGSNIDFDNLFAVLARAEQSNTPFALLGASFSLVHMLDEMQKRDLRFKLAAGSQILDTGGFKGQSREIELDEFYDLLKLALGVDRKDCINMYGMTELSTQFYDDGNAQCPSRKSGPHWIRTRVIEPLSGTELPIGETGVLVHCDLAHFNIVSTILTEDVGYANADGSFVLLGRAEGTQAAGCSLAVEEFLKAASQASAKAPLA